MKKKKMMKNLEKTLGQGEEKSAPLQITQGKGGDQSSDDEESEDEEEVREKKGKEISVSKKKEKKPKLISITESLVRRA